MPYTPKDCPSQTSSFTIEYKGERRAIRGRILNLPACDAHGEPNGRCYSRTEAGFGVSPYGTPISGALFYNFLGDVRTGCSAVASDFGIKGDDKNSVTKILLLERGGCSFMKKVRIAQVRHLFIL